MHTGSVLRHRVYVCVDSCVCLCVCVCVRLVQCRAYHRPPPVDDKKPPGVVVDEMRTQGRHTWNHMHALAGATAPSPSLTCVCGGDGLGTDHWTLPQWTDECGHLMVGGLKRRRDR